ncbi:hypothetical protein DV737_g3875, partial [Chaetothyriales sp. CBS 132003]
MSSKDGAQNQAGSLANTASSAFKTTTGTVSSAAANLSGAGADAFSKTTDLQADGQQLSKEEADKLYEERIEEEYAKREGGA